MQFRIINFIILIELGMFFLSFRSPTLKVYLQRTQSLSILLVIEIGINIQNQFTAILGYRDTYR